MHILFKALFNSSEQSQHNWVAKQLKITWRQTCLSPRCTFQLLPDLGQGTLQFCLSFVICNSSDNNRTPFVNLFMRNNFLLCTKHLSTNHVPGIVPSSSLIQGSSLSSFKFSSNFFHLTCVQAQLRLTFCNPMDCTPPRSSAHGICQARTTGVGCHFFLQGLLL